MSSINLRGYEIAFPYPVPYDIQKTYMDKVLTCLDEKTHAVLESPTGTGKTLCLFAPVTAWAREKKRQNVPYISIGPDGEVISESPEQNDQQRKWGNKGRSKIWYTARTHSQIAQTVGEVRKCNIDGLHVRVMGARDQLCINKLVLEEKDSYVKTVKCKELVKGKQCKYYTKLTYEKDLQKYYQRGEVLDIEDLVSVGKSCNICPYFLAKKASETADIVLLPYNYIIDKDSRESNGFYLQDDIIIFDEGHNIPSTCEESYEFNFSSLDIAIGIKNIRDLMTTLTNLNETIADDEEINLAEHASNSMFLMEVLQKLEAGLDDLPMSNELLPVTYLHRFFEKAGISERTSKQLTAGIQSFKDDSGKLALSGSILETFNLLEKMMNVIFGPTVRSFDQNTIERSFKCGVTIDPERHNNVKKLSLFCFNPSFGIRTLLHLGVQSIIITSGTLSPLRTFISELSLPKPVVLENGHIAKKCQVPFVILGTGVNNIKMDGAYKNRSDPKYIFSLGMTLTNLIASVPDGVLVLFSSYAMMQNLKEAWESDLGIWNRLNTLKRVFVEPRGKDEFINCMENYKRAIDSGNGAILMGVLRGKISEGMDFKDQYCRGVFIVGVPFPPVQDPRVQGKEKYSESLTIFNTATQKEEKLYNNSFMSVEAMKATNQAIGRVIRHGQDYGVIVLVDYRFAWPRLFLNISSWLRGPQPVEYNFTNTKKLIRDFFRVVHLGKLGIEEIRCQTVDGNGCPVASYVSFEEYDHKKHAAHPVAWIGGETTSDDLKHKRVKSPKNINRRGNSLIQYVDDSPDKLVSLYKNSREKPASCGIKSFQSSGSLLDMLESSRSSGVGYREFDKNSFFEQNSESNKRKYEDEEYHETKSSLSTLSSPLPSKNQQRKIPKLKFRPLIPASEESGNNSEGSLKSNTEKKGKKKEEELKAKLINYYKQARQVLSKELDEKFKTDSCKYMRGETSLTDVIKLMDECFVGQGNKSLFAGFGICVKGKDQNQWLEACRIRKIEVSPEK